jgi:2-keto-3-deoxy-L-arabinonate dehydratase
MHSGQLLRAFSLDDTERVAIVETTIARTAGRLPITVTTSHFSARVAAARSREAQERGASMVMLKAPFFGTSMRATEDGVVEYFKRVTGDLRPFALEWSR